jgi:hypothetical protein
MGTKAGVAADWTQLPGYLSRSSSGLVVKSQERLEVGGRWSLRWEGQPAELDAYVYRRDEVDRLSPSRLGGERSKEKLGDILAEFDFKPDVLWQFKNVTLHLRSLDPDLHEGPNPAARARLIRLAKKIQAFLEAAVVSDLDAVTPRLELPIPEEKVLLLGAPLRLAWRAVNAAPEECRLEIRSDGFKGVTSRASEIIATPERVGSVGLWLSLRHTRNLLRSPFAELTFQSVRDKGRPMVKVQARYLEDTRIEEGPGLRLRVDHEQKSRGCTDVFFISLDEQRSAVLQFGGPRSSSAPPSIAMRLEKALLLDGAGAVVPLGPSEFHVEQRQFPQIRGTISLASQDWEIAAVSRDAASGDTWREELRRRGVEVVE